MLHFRSWCSPGIARKVEQVLFSAWHGNPEHPVAGRLKRDKHVAFIVGAQLAPADRTADAHRAANQCPLVAGDFIKLRRGGGGGDGRNSEDRFVPSGLLPGTAPRQDQNSRKFHGCDVGGRAPLKREAIGCGVANRKNCAPVSAQVRPKRHPICQLFWNYEISRRGSVPKTQLWAK